MIVPLKESQRNIISSPDKAYKLMKDVFSERGAIDKDRENAWIIGLDRFNKALAVELISMGTQNMTLVDPKEVFCMPLRNRFSKIILVHNHPSGSWMPSFSDIDMTDNLIQVGRLVSIPVVDHIILFASTVSTGLYKSDSLMSGKDDMNSSSNNLFGEIGYFSFANFGLIDILKKYSFYMPISECHNREKIVSKRIDFCIKNLKKISEIEVNNQENKKYRINYF